MLLASVVLLTVSFKPIAVISALLKLAIGAAQLNLSGYFLWATINSTASNGLLIPALIWGTWIACAVIELISTWVQYSFSAGSAR